MPTLTPMMKNNAPPPPPDVAPSERLTQRLQALAEASISGIRNLALVSFLSATWIWGWALGPLTFGSRWGAGLGILVLLLLLAPSAVLGLGYWGLREIRSLPARVRRAFEEGSARAGTAWRETRTETPRRGRGLWRIVKGLREIWSLVSDSRETLLAYVALARLANPITLIAMLAAIFGTVALAVTAVITAAIVLVR